MSHRTRKRGRKSDLTIALGKLHQQVEASSQSVPSAASKKIKLAHTTGLPVHGWQVCQDSHMHHHIVLHVFNCIANLPH